MKRHICLGLAAAILASASVSIADYSWRFDAHTNTVSGTANEDSLLFALNTGAGTVQTSTSSADAGFNAWNSLSGSGTANASFSMNMQVGFGFVLAAPTYDTTDWTTVAADNTFRFRNNGGLLEGVAPVGGGTGFSPFEILHFTISGLGAGQSLVLKGYEVKDNNGERIDLYYGAGLTKFDASGYISDVSSLGITLVNGDQFGFAYDRASGNRSSLKGITFDIIGDASAESTLTLNPATQASMTLTALENSTTGTVAAAFQYGTASRNVEITSVAINNQQHPGSFTSLASTPFTMTDPSPTNQLLSIVFDNSVALLASHGATSTGIVAVVWKEVAIATLYTSAVPVSVTFSAPLASLSLNPSRLEMNIISPATIRTGAVAVAYTADTLAPTNVVITAVAFSNMTHSGFSNATTLPLTLTDPSPANQLLSIAFNNAIAGLSVGQATTGNVVVTWNEIGKSSQQKLLPVSVSIIETAVMAWSVEEFNAVADVSTNGTLLEAVNWAGVSNGTINGVTFIAAPKATDVSTTYWKTLVDNSVVNEASFEGNTNSWSEVDRTAVEDSNVMDSMMSDSDSPAENVITLAGLTPGQKYLIQLFISDDGRSAWNGNG